MADHSQPLPSSESDDEADFYRMMEEYTKQVRLRYDLPVRLNLRRVSALGKGSAKSHFGVK